MEDSLIGQVFMRWVSQNALHWDLHVSYIPWLVELSIKVAVYRFHEY